MIATIWMRRSATVQVTVQRINGWPANWPYRSQTGPSSANPQLLTAAPSLDVDELATRQAPEGDRSRPPPIAGATGERNDRDRRAPTLELLPHSPASHQLTTPGTQPGRMRPRCLTTRRRAARVPGPRPASGTAPRPPSARHAQTRRRRATCAV